MGKTAVSVVSGDVTRIKADALITAINSGGMWFGGIDGAIQRVAGELFHSQAENAMPLRDGQIVVAKGSISNRGDFRNVVFVVDDLKRPLHDIVCSGLRAAAEAGFKSVTLSTIRMGIMLGEVEKSPKEVAKEVATGIRQFFASSPSALKSITFVVYNDSKALTLFQKVLG